MTDELSRRSFLGWIVAALSSGSMAGRAQAAGGSMPYRVMGRSGEKVSLVGLGGYHIGLVAENEAIAIMHDAIDRGINFFDNCWDYHDGGAELVMGKALSHGRRDKVFLMSKIDGRTRKAAASQIDDCLRRLRTDRIDLMQIHEVIRLSDADRCFGPGGAMEALIAARQAGKIKYIGFTGHKSPAMHLKMIETARKNKFTFDAVQMPLNVMDAHYDSFEKVVIPELVKDGIGVLAMKPLGAGTILKSKAVTPIECLQYAMSLPASVVITGIQSRENLEQALNAAQTFKPFTPEMRASLLRKTETLARNGRYELYKSSYMYDGTRHHPEWMG